MLSLLGGVGGCTPVIDTHSVSERLSELFSPPSHTERAMRELGQGDLSNAEHDALAALRHHPDDPYALLVAALVFQSTGRYQRASRYYQAILDENPTAAIMLPEAGGAKERHSIVSIARANLGAIAKILGRPVPASATALPVSAANGSVAGQAVMTVPSAAALPAAAEADVAGRFRILKELLADNLITPTEYAARRSANLGALLPYSEPPPAVGLARPIPPDHAVIDRLRALKSAVQAGEMTPDQQSAEREIILDALLPANPARRAPPPPLPRDMLAAASAVGRLERMAARGLVTPAEVAREKAAIKRALAANLAGQPVVGTETGLVYGTPPSAETGVSRAKVSDGTAHHGHVWGVSLAITVSQGEAERQAPVIKAKFPEELGAKHFKVQPIYYKGGTRRWRVVAGPFADRQAAAAMCGRLHLHRQRCYLAWYR